MNTWRTLQTAWEGVAANKMRSFLTVLGVVIGVAAVILMVGVSKATEAAIADTINSLGSDLITSAPLASVLLVTRGGCTVAAGWPHLRRRCRHLPGGERIEGAAPEQIMPGQTVRHDRATLTTLLVGTTADYPTCAMWRRTGPLTEQDLERAIKVAVLGHAVAEELFLKATPLARASPWPDNVRLTVVGVMASKGTVAETDYDNRIYVPIAWCSRSSCPPHGVMIGNPWLPTPAESQETMGSAIAQITSLLNKRHNIVGEPISGPNPGRHHQDATGTAPPFAACWPAGAVSSLVGGIGIMNIMLVSVTGAPAR